jgi:hypothetical protein
MNDDERMADALQESPEIADRTARYLAGDLEEGPVAEELAQIVFRLPDVKLKKSLEARADALVDVLEVDALHRVSRASVFREALVLGLAVLERKHAEALKSTPTKRKR